MDTLFQQCKQNDSNKSLLLQLTKTQYLQDGDTDAKHYLEIVCRVMVEKMCSKSFHRDSDFISYA